MTDEIKPPGAPPIKETIKDVFVQEVEESAKVLIRNVISPKSLGIAIIAWCLLSFALSIYIRANGMCSVNRVQLGKYIAGRLLCEEK